MKYIFAELALIYLGICAIFANVVLISFLTGKVEIDFKFTDSVKACPFYEKK